MPDTLPERSPRPHLTGGEANQLGVTFWTFRLDTTTDGRGGGGIKLSVNVHSTKEGLRIGGETIPWSEIDTARQRLKRKASAGS
jgi:hypothetical protein